MFRPNDITIPSKIKQQIAEDWAPILKESNLINEHTSPEKIMMLSEMAHLQQMNEAAPELSVIPGLGNPSFGSTLGSQSNFVNGATGSGDKWISPFAVAMQVAAKTVGFDIVSTIPISAPAGMVYYADYIYADGKIDGAGASGPLLFKLGGMVGFTGVVGTRYFGVSTQADIAVDSGSGNAIYMEYLGLSRKTGYPIFKVVSTGTFANNDYTVTNDKTLAQIFDGAAGWVVAANTDQGTNSLTTGAIAGAVTGTAEYVVAMEDNVYGFANGEGGQSAVQYSGSYTDGLQQYNGALRGQAEGDEHKDLGFRITSKNIETREFKASVSLTQQQLQDMKKQHGWDLIQKTEQALVNETAQSINRNILGRAFALGWQNHYNITLAEGANFNLALDPAYTTANVSATYAKYDGTTQAIVVPVFATYSTSTASMENQETLQRRIVTKIFAASDMINARGRIGAATGIVTNTQIASALKSVSGYVASPFENKMSQVGGTLYPAGSIAGMQLYVDPNMRYADTRVLVFRKGADDEPGLKFLPYLLGESVSTISANTGAPRIFMSSRYALTEYGQHPEMQYLTFFVKVSGSIV